MGKITQGILGGVAGKVGPVVGFNWKGIDALRSYVIPSNPQTTSQQNNRTVFAQLVAIGRGLLGSVLQPFWDPFANKQSGFNRFIGVNKKAMGASFDPSLMKVAEGSLESTTISSVTLTGTTVDFAWNDIPSGNGLATDVANLVVIDKSTNAVWTKIGGATRQDGGDSITVASGLTAANLSGYVFFNRGSGSNLEVSDSAYSAVV